MTLMEIKMQREEKMKSQKNYEKRRDDIKGIIKKIDNNLTGFFSLDAITSINVSINGCSSSLEEGLKGTGTILTSCYDMRTVKEKDTDSDPQLSSCRNSLSSEVSFCQNKIDTLKSEIKSLEEQFIAQGGRIFQGLFIIPESPPGSGRSF